MDETEDVGPDPSAGVVKPRSVDILAFPMVQLLDVTGPLQVFATANDVATAGGGIAPYEIRVVSRGGNNVEASAGVVLETYHLPTEDTPIDTLLIAGGRGVDAASDDEALLDWLKGRAATVRRIGSVCTGAVLLAKVGMLDGRRVVTHWSICDELARRFPRIRVDADAIFVRDGSVWTSAGVTAGIDLALALVEEDLGRSLALEVARYLVVFLKRPGGQAQFSAALAMQSPDGRFDAVNSWVRENLTADLSLRALAEHAAMSERSFSRHYKNATGFAPARAVERLRIEAAQHLLTDTRLPVKNVAARCGFPSEEAMRRSFLRRVRIGPLDYRHRFGSSSTA